MTHTDIDPPGDWIELHNTTGQDINIGGWWLSDKPDLPAKYRIAAGTIIPAHGYIVVTQYDHFGSTLLPADQRFALDELGESILLSSATSAGLMTGYAHRMNFDAADNGVTFGRVANSAGRDYFVSVAEPTPGYANAAPIIGPVVINEIMYNPPPAGDEYVELRNISGTAVSMDNWRFTRGFEYTFGAVTLAAGEYVLVVGIDPTAFRTKYGIGASIQIFGPFSGALDNAGETVTLSRPGLPELDGTFGYVVVDSVDYDDVEPWTIAADGAGASLARRMAGEFGSEPNNWVGEPGGTPGAVNQDAMMPTAEIVDVSPDPRPYPVDSVEFIFSEPVIGFDLADLSLVRGAGPNLLTGQAKLSTSDTITWILSGLSRLTWVQGFYTLTLTAAGSGITDQTGNPLGGNASDTFVVSRSHIAGTGGDDAFFIRAVGADLEIFTSAEPTGEPAYRGPLAALTDLTIDAGDGDDLMVLASPVGMSLVGGAGQDRAELRGTAAGEAFTLSPGTLQWGTAAILRTSIEAVHVDGGDGDDTLTMDGSLLYVASFNGRAGIDTLVIEDGVHAFESDLEASAEHLEIHGAEARVTFLASQHLALLTADGGASVAMTPGGLLVLRAGDLVLAGGATLDLADNRLIVQDDAGTGESGIVGMLLGDGIISSSPDDPQGMRHMAMIVNDNGHGGVIRTEFGGESVGAGAILVMHTWKGDTDLNAVIDGDDYFRLDAGFLAQRGGYQHGDFNFDEKTDGQDYFMIDLAYLSQPVGGLSIPLGGGYGVAGQPAAMQQADESVSHVDEWLRDERNIW